MAALERFFYLVKELAGNRWPKASEDDIYHWGAAGEFTFSFFMKRATAIINGEDACRFWPQEHIIVDIPPEKAAAFLNPCPCPEGDLELCCFLKDGEIVFFGDRLTSQELESEAEHGETPTEGYQIHPRNISRNELVIKTSEVLLMEEKYPELTGGNGNGEKYRGKGPNPENTDDEKPLRGAKEICAFLGISSTSLKNRMKKKGFPIHKRGGSLYAYKSELNDWIKKHPAKSKKK